MICLVLHSLHDTHNESCIVSAATGPLPFHKCMLAGFIHQVALCIHLFFTDQNYMVSHGNLLFEKQELNTKVKSKVK